MLNKKVLFKLRLFYVYLNSISSLKFQSLFWYCGGGGRPCWWLSLFQVDMLNKVSFVTAAADEVVPEAAAADIHWDWKLSLE